LYLKDGWEGVDAIYQNPPQSTEQILHPERYPRDEPVFLERPDLTPLYEIGWQVAHHDVLGEWLYLAMLEGYLDELAASQAAEGWAGDIAALLYNPARETWALILVGQWDTMRDAHEFTTAYKDYGILRFGDAAEVTPTGAEWTVDDPGVLFERYSNQTVIIMGPVEDLQTIREALVLPVPTSP
jgi:hypothetical protein